MNQVQRALVLGGAVLAMVLVAVTVFAHDDVITKCSNQQNVKQVSDAMLPNGLLAERYDTNGDGKADIVALSYTTGTTQLGGGKVEVEHSAMPVFYVIDQDLDGEPDKIYVDTHGNGTCDGIVEYQDLHGPLTNDAIKRGGLVGDSL